MIGQPLNFMLITRTGKTSTSCPYATLEFALSAYSTAVREGADYAKVVGPLGTVYALHGEE